MHDGETHTTIIAATSSNIANPEISIWRYKHRRQGSEDPPQKKSLEVVFWAIDRAFMVSLRMLLVLVLGLLLMDAIVSMQVTSPRVDTHTFSGSRLASK